MTKDKVGFKCKVGDFGISKVIDQDLMQTIVGTPVYLAPELIRKLAYTS